MNGFICPHPSTPELVRPFAAVVHNSRLSHESQPLENRPLFSCETYVQKGGLPPRLKYDKV